MQTFITILHIFTCVLLIITVLIQSGKGAEVSASFGGSSQTIFGSSGGANFFTKLTSVLAAIFMVTSLALTWFGSDSKKGVMESAPVTQTSAPATPAAPVAPSSATTTPPAENSAKPAQPEAPKK